MDEPDRQRAEAARQHAIGVAAETMGELVEFWGFKASMGRIWTLLYLSSNPLTADDISARTALSAGAVSMALAELAQWGLVHREPTPSERKRHYRAETDVWALIRRIFRERELRLVGRAVDQFGRALTALEEARNLAPDDPETEFAHQRLSGLIELAKLGYGMIQQLAELGRFSLLPIRGSLERSKDGK